MRIPRRDPREGEPTMSKLTKTIVVLVGTAALLFGVATAAYASLPAGTTVTGKLKTGTHMIFKGDIDSVPITVTCTNFLVKGKITSPASNTMKTSAPPTISGCHDSSGGTDTIHTSGTWSVTIAKTTMTLNVPKAG